jgi:hypothetical protein
MAHRIHVLRDVQPTVEGAVTTLVTTTRRITILILLTLVPTACGTASDRDVATGSAPSTAPASSQVETPRSRTSDPARDVDLEVARQSENRSKRTTPMGAVCWSVTEVAHIVLEYVVPTYDSTYDDLPDRDRAAAAGLAEVEAELRSQQHLLPRPAVRFVDQLLAALAEVRAMTDAERLDAARFAAGAEQLFTFDDYDGAESFIAEADASPDCVGLRGER